MTTGFSDLKELLLHPLGKGSDQIAQYGTTKKGLLTFLVLEFLCCLLLGFLIAPLVGFFMPHYYREIIAWGSLIVVIATFVIFVGQTVSIALNSAIFYGLYRLTKGTASWTDVAKGFMYGKLFSDIYIVGILILVSLMIPSYSTSALWLGVAIFLGVFIWAIYVNVHLMSRILGSKKLTVFVLYIGLAIINVIIRYMLAS